jgi:hypothetical protein
MRQSSRGFAVAVVAFGGVAGTPTDHGAFVVRPMRLSAAGAGSTLGVATGQHSSIVLQVLHVPNKGVQ